MSSSTPRHATLSISWEAYFRDLCSYLRERSDRRPSHTFKNSLFKDVKYRADVTPLLFPRFSIVPVSEAVQTQTWSGHGESNTGDSDPKSDAIPLGYTPKNQRPPEVFIETLGAGKTKNLVPALRHITGWLRRISNHDTAFCRFELLMPSHNQRLPCTFEVVKNYFGESFTSCHGRNLCTSTSAP